jgi:glycosyltransferase involved in cell wall biosynthesis
MRYFDGRRGADGLPRAVLYNGSSPQRCHPSRDRRNVRAEWGLDDDCIALGFLGRQSPEKNPLAPAKAVASLPRCYHAIYYGVGPKGNGFCPETMAWCETNIPGRYRMYPPSTAVGDILRGFDVLILASQREAFSLTLIEAWLTGVPVVATPVGSIPELEAKFGQLTFSIPLQASDEELRSAVTQAMSVSLRAKVTSRARAVAWKHFTVEAMAGRWMDYLEGVVAGNNDYRRR